MRNLPFVFTYKNKNFLFYTSSKILNEVLFESFFIPESNMVHSHSYKTCFLKKCSLLFRVASISEIKDFSQMDVAIKRTYWIMSYLEMIRKKHKKGKVWRTGLFHIFDCEIVIFRRKHTIDCPKQWNFTFNLKSMLY